MERRHLHQNEPSQSTGCWPRPPEKPPVDATEMEVDGADQLHSVLSYLQVRREEESYELQETIEYLNEMHGALMVTIQRKQKLLGEVPELREKLCQAIRALDEEISANEVELKGTKQNLRLLQKDRRTNVEEWRDTDAARDWLGEVVVVGGWVLCLSLVRLGERGES